MFLRRADEQWQGTIAATVHGAVAGGFGGVPSLSSDAMCFDQIHKVGLHAGFRQGLMHSLAVGLGSRYENRWPPAVAADAHAAYNAVHAVVRLARIGQPFQHHRGSALGWYETIGANVEWRGSVARQHAQHASIRCSTREAG